MTQRIADPEAARHAALFAEHPCVQPDRITFNAVYNLFVAAE
jgi:hypothetical protein